jgi:hypothetical protein
MVVYATTGFAGAPMARQTITRGLLIESPYIDRILVGRKTWELRGSRTSIGWTDWADSQRVGAGCGHMRVGWCCWPVDSCGVEEEREKGWLVCVKLLVIAIPSDLCVGSQTRQAAENPTALQASVRGNPLGEAPSVQRLTAGTRRCRTRRVVPAPRRSFSFVGPAVWR